MFTHDAIWAAIDALAEKTGYSTSGLAKQAGLDPTSFNKSKRLSPDGKPRWPSTESISKVLRVTKTPMGTFIRLITYEHARPVEAQQQKLILCHQTGETEMVYLLREEENGFFVEDEEGKQFPILKTALQWYAPIIETKDDL